jgi:hypothetical protein
MEKIAASYKKPEEVEEPKPEEIQQETKEEEPKK